MSEAARQLVKRRWSKLTAAERSEIGRVTVNKRWAAYRLRKAAEAVADESQSSAKPARSQRVKARQGK